MGSGAESCFSGSNLPGTSTVLVPLTRPVATSISSADRGSRKASILLLVSLTPSRVGQHEPLSGSSNDYSASAILMYAYCSVFMQKEMREASIPAKDPMNSSSADSSSD